MSFRDLGPDCLVLAVRQSGEGHLLVRSAEGGEYSGLVLSLKRSLG